MRFCSFSMNDFWPTFDFVVVRHKSRTARVYQALFIIRRHIQYRCNCVEKCYRAPYVCLHRWQRASGKCICPLCEFYALFGWVCLISKRRVFNFVRQSWTAEKSTRSCIVCPVCEWSRWIKFKLTVSFCCKAIHLYYFIAGNGTEGTRQIIYARVMCVCALTKRFQCEIKRKHIIPIMNAYWHSTADTRLSPSLSLSLRSLSCAWSILCLLLPTYRVK